MECILIYAVNFIQLCHEFPNLQKKINIYFYPDFSFYPDITRFLSDVDYSDKNWIIFLIYPDNSFYPDLNITITYELFFYDCTPD